jgi:hypothetical protein
MGDVPPFWRRYGRKMCWLDSSPRLEALKNPEEVEEQSKVKPDEWASSETA